MWLNLLLPLICPRHWEDINVRASGNSLSLGGCCIEHIMLGSAGNLREQPDVNWILNNLYNEVTSSAWKKPLLSILQKIFHLVPTLKMPDMRAVKMSMRNSNYNFNHRLLPLCLEILHNDHIFSYYTTNYKSLWLLIITYFLFSIVKIPTKWCPIKFWNILWKTVLVVGKLILPVALNLSTGFI